MNASHSHPALAGLGTGRCLVIGEVALSHDGSLGLAHRFVDAIADAGADAVKFQTHIAAAESTPAEPFRVKFSRQDASRYEYWRRMEFTEDEWRGLAEHCAQRQVLFISSPFSIEAVELLERVGGQPFWKIASGEVSNTQLLDRVLATGAPVVLSSGLSPLAETDAAVARVKARHRQVGVMQCTTAYPCPPERVGLNLVPVYRERYGCWVGLSDHSATIYPGLAGAALGLDLLEVHVARRAPASHVPVFHYEHCAVCLTGENLEIEMAASAYRFVRLSCAVSACLDNLNGLCSVFCTRKPRSERKSGHCP